jgi:hypothetical protein
MSREVQSVFPDVDLSGMLVVPTCQQADYDLVRTGEKIDTEKDRLLERVSSWAPLVDRLCSHPALRNSSCQPTSSVLHGGHLVNPTLCSKHMGIASLKCSVPCC